jgi:CRP/FNR family transcriptional regulator, cyclic AMP receptor protein
MADKSERQCAAGEVIFREGEAAGEMYILLEGAVELRKKVEGAERLLKTVDAPNEFFGEMAVIDHRPRSATALAVGATRLLVVNEAAFENLILTNGRFALKVIKGLSERIRGSNLQISELVESDARERLAYGLVGYAQARGERAYGGGLKVEIAGVQEWLNKRLGFSPHDIDAGIDRLLKGGQVQYAAGKAKDALVLSALFIERNDRRNPTTSRPPAGRAK